MKYFLCIATAVLLAACNPQNDKIQYLQNQVDSLQANAYKPGFGEFMSSIQVHHNKLWFAGENKNWKLADFEVHEIIEAIDDIQKYQTERKESQKIGMILPALDTVNAAIHQKNAALFRNSFITLTNTCNNCHRAVDFEFNVVTIPGNPPFSNQDFKYQDDKQ